MTIQECYDILGVNASSSKDEIKKKYRELCFKYHPDRNSSPDAEHKFKELTNAYEVLQGKRKPKDQNSGYNHRRGSPFYGFDFSNFDPFDIFRGAKRNKHPQTDAEVTVNINISIEDIKKGRELRANYNLEQDCESCKGVGGEQNSICGQCHGQGMVQEVKSDPGGIMHVTTRSCISCKGKGRIMKNPCASCNANGKVIKQESIEFEIRKV